MFQRVFFFFLCLVLCAFFDPYTPQEILVDNTILTKVNDTPISVIDVKKKMDLFIHQADPENRASAIEKLQFYEGSWRPTLMQMVDHSLILADAAAKGIDIPEGEIREEMQHRFGPKVMSTLESLGITHEEAFRFIKEEFIVQRMSWWFIHSRAMQQVSPGDVKTSYQAYLEKSPPYELLSYRILSVQTEENQASAEKLQEHVKKHPASPTEQAAALLQIDPTVRISKSYQAKDLEMCEEHVAALRALAEGSYSEVVFSGKGKARIFFLEKRQAHPAPTFKELYNKLQQELLQKKTEEITASYLGRLRKEYGYDLTSLKESFPETLHPFYVR